MHSAPLRMHGGLLIKAGLQIGFVWKSSEHLEKLCIIVNLDYSISPSVLTFELSKSDLIIF